MNLEPELPPIDMPEGRSEQIDISKHVKCRHKNLITGRGFIRCKDCGMEWRGSRLNELYKLLIERN